MFVTPGRTYDVYALCVFQGLVFLQIVGDEPRWPIWNPAWLFDVVSPSIPSDWIVGLFDAEPSLILGPEYVARDIESYVRMVELDRDALNAFWSRLQQLNIGD